VSGQTSGDERGKYSNRSYCSNSSHKVHLRLGKMMAAKFIRSSRLNGTLRLDFVFSYSLGTLGGLTDGNPFNSTIVRCFGGLSCRCCAPSGARRTSVERHMAGRMGSEKNSRIPCAGLEWTGYFGNTESGS
jgi:hypothetical protein